MMGDLEEAILCWISENTGSPELEAQIRFAEVVKRDFMGTGLFLYLRVPESLDAIPDSVSPNCPHISSSMLMDGAGSSLFMKNGRLHYLELYSRGGFMPETLEKWELEAGRL
jgi:hypothetical protein